MMNPTPEQLAFAFAMLTLRRGSEANDTILPSPLNRVGRLLAMVIVGVATGLFGLSYIDNNLATGGRSQAEIRSMRDPSPLAKDVFASQDGNKAAFVE